MTRLSDVARIELGAQDYSRRSYLDGKPAIAVLVYQRPGTNAVDSADAVKQTMRDLSEDFPDGLGYEIAYNPTDYVEESIDEVFYTLYITTALVVLTVFIFLHGWRPTIIPVVAIPISLIGTFGAMQWIGVSLNTLSLFGLVLAIGIVVDDAIVVVENVERLIAEGLKPREATHQGDGRSWVGIDCDHAGFDCGLCAYRFRPRNQRSVLSAVCSHDRDRDSVFDVCFLDADTGPVCVAVAAQA